MSKIPKIKKGDRVKIYDGEDLLIVAPLTHNASIRYGHKTSWCTSTSNIYQWDRHSKKGVLIYCIFYKNEGRKTEFTKVAIYIKFHKFRRGKTELYDSPNNYIDKHLVEVLLGSKWELVEKYYQEKNREHYKDKIFKIVHLPVGKCLKGISNRAIRISYRKNGLYFSIKATWKDILNAEVVKNFDESFRIKITELSPALLKNKIFNAIKLDSIELFKRVNYAKEMPLEPIKSNEQKLQSKTNAMKT